MKKSLVIAAALAIAVSACGGDSEGATATTLAGSPTSTPATGGQDATTTTAGSANPGAPGGGGSATLTIGDSTYEFDNYYCLQGSDNTGNARVSFSSGAFGEVDGVRVQLDASIQDRNEGNAMDGEGTIQSVTLNDIEDFQNPSVAWEATAGFIGVPEWVVEYDGSKVHAEAVFDDTSTDQFEQIPGTLDATCGG